MKRIKKFWSDNGLALGGWACATTALGWRVSVAIVGIFALALHYGIKAVEAWIETGEAS